MPDENSAADEHAIIQEVAAPLASLPDNTLPAAAEVEFPMALRGYDRLAVDAYVKRTTQLVAELQTTRSPEAAVRRALERVGEEVSGILQRAHEAAAQITTQSRSEAEDRLETARQEAAQITVDARERLKDLDAETDRIWAERQRIVEDAQDLANQLLTLAQSAAERFPADETPGPEGPGAGAIFEAPEGAALNGEDPDPAAPPVFGSGPSEEEPSRHAPSPEGPEGPEEPEEAEPGSEWPEEAVPGPAGPGDSFDDDVTAIMRPIKPEEGEPS